MEGLGNIAHRTYIEVRRRIRRLEEMYVTHLLHNIDRGIVRLKDYAEYAKYTRQRIFQ